MAQIDEHTLVPIGVVGAAGFAVWRAVAWVLGLSAKVERSTERLDKLEEQVSKNADSFSGFYEALSEQSERMARIEERIIFIADTIKK